MAEQTEANNEVSEVKEEVLTEAETKTDEEILYSDKDVEVKESKSEEVVEAKEETKEEVKEESHAEDKELELAIPEGSGLSEKDIAEMKEFAKTNKLSQESAQKLLDDKANFATELTKRQQAEFQAKTNTWLSEIKQSKTFDEDLKLAQLTQEKFFDKDFSKMLKDSGLGNHPALFKGLAKIGREMKPKGIEQGAKNAAAPVKEDWEVFYGSN